MYKKNIRHGSLDSRELLLGSFLIGGQLARQKNAIGWDQHDALAEWVRCVPALRPEGDSRIDIAVLPHKMGSLKRELAGLDSLRVFYGVEPQIWKYGTPFRYVGGGASRIPRAWSHPSAVYAFDQCTFGEGTFGEQAHSIFFMESSHKYGNIEPVHLTRAFSRKDAVRGFYFSRSLLSPSVVWAGGLGGHPGA